MPPPTKVLVPLGLPSTISVISLADHSSRQLDVNEDATLPEDIPLSGFSPF